MRPLTKLWLLTAFRGDSTLALYAELIDFADSLCYVKLDIDQSGLNACREGLCLSVDNLLVDWNDFDL